MYKHILIPTDGSELSNKAIHHGIALAKAVNAKVTGITVTTPFHVIGHTHRYGGYLQETHYRASSEIPETGKRCRSGSRC